MRVSPQRFLHLMLVLAIFLIIPTTQSYPSGVGDVANNGCICHGSIEESTEITIDGLPIKFDSNTSYFVTMRVNDSTQNLGDNSTIGGFRILVSHGEVVFEDTVNTQKIDDGWTHTADGNKYREWNFTWISPMDNTSYVEFKIHGNAVDGNGNSYGDAWNSLNFKVPGVQNFEELSTESTQYELEFYEKVILAIVGLAIIFLAYRAIK